MVVSRRETRWCRVPATLALLLGLVAPLTAQSPEERAALESFRDSLNHTSDSIGLMHVEKRMIEVAKANRNDAMQHLRLGFLAIRLGDLGGKTHYDDGAGEFEWATQLQPEWPYAWYGLGLAEDGVGDSQVSLVAGLQTMFGKDHLTRAANAYAHSVKVDPTFVKGLVDLASTALRQRVNIKIDLAREALREAAATSAAKNPEVLLYRGRVEREVGDPDSALAAFQLYLTLGGRKGLGLLEVARTKFVLGSLDGQLPYYEGAAEEDSESVQAYRADLALVAEDSAVGEFDANQGAHRVAFLKRFWGLRDRDEMRKDGERLREHYRRYYYAKHNFQLVSPNRHYDIVERYRSGSRDFDDRGIIYIRHGEPTTRATYTAPTLEPNESWRYARADGDLIFHFVAREDVQDYKLVESVFDVLGFGNTVVLRNDANAGGAQETASQLVQTRQTLSPLYSHLLTSGTASAGAQRYLTEERELGKRSITLGTRTDSYELSYPRDLKVRTTVVVAGADSGQALLHVTYAIPGSSLDGVESSRGIIYPIRVRLAVMDRQGHPLATLDTLRMKVAKERVPNESWLVGRESLRVPAGQLFYRLAVQEGERDEHGTLLPRDSVLAGDFSGGAFDISDLVIGSRTSNVIWRPQGEDTVFFSPLASFAQRATMELYYEVYGLPQGAPYKLQIAVTKQGGGKLLGIFGSRKAAISLGFEEHSEGPVTRSHRSLGLEKLSPGDYWIDLKVTDEQGITRTRREQFEVTKQ